MRKSKQKKQQPSFSLNCKVRHVGAHCTTTIIIARQVMYHGLLLQLPFVFMMAEMRNLLLPREKALSNSKKAKKYSRFSIYTCGPLKVCGLLLMGQRSLRKANQLRANTNVLYDRLSHQGKTGEVCNKNMLQTTIFIHRLVLARFLYCFHRCELNTRNISKSIYAQTEASNLIFW